MADLNALVLRAFGGGELAPGLSARADIGLYQQGLRTCRNFIIQRHGGVANRTGTKYIAEVKDSANPPSLLKFVFNSTLTYVMEFGSGYIRFFHNGARVEVSSVAAWADATLYTYGAIVSDGGTNYVCILSHTSEVGVIETDNTTYWYPLTDDIYELPTPFLANLHLLRATQDTNIVTLTHKDYPPHELRNEGAATAWVFEEINTEPGISSPGNLTGTAGVVGTRSRFYQVTAIDEETGEESYPSETFELELAGEGTIVTPHELSCDPVATANEYRWYCDPEANGTFGYIGSSMEVETFADSGIAPDFALTPPIIRELFWATLNYPHTAAYYQQRRVFANTHTDVGTVWASRTGFPSNFSIRSPLQDDDAVTFTPKGRQVLGIQHVIGLKRLLLLTDGGEWIVLGGEDGVLTPSTIHPEQEGHFGSAASPVPCVLGNDVVYTQYLSRVVRLLQLNETHTGFRSATDLTVFAGHLFVPTVLRMDAQVIPHSMVWCVMDEGTLLSLTYLPESDIYGWARHDTGDGDNFLDVCVVPEGDEHALYVLVSRDVDGDTVVYLERFVQRELYDADNLADAFFLDCGITYSGASATAITGLDHLEDREVFAWTDGTTVQGPFTVTAGAITLTTAATKAQIGLPITAQLKTLALDVNGSDVRAKRKRVQAMHFIVERSLPGFYAGPDEDHLHPVRTAGVWESATTLKDGEFELNMSSAFTENGQTLIQHTNPTPLTLLGLIPVLEVGK